MLFTLAPLWPSRLCLSLFFLILHNIQLTPQKLSAGRNNRSCQMRQRVARRPRLHRRRRPFSFFSFSSSIPTSTTPFYRSTRSETSSPRPTIDSPCECEHNNPDSLDARLFPSVVLAVAPAVTMDAASSLSPTRRADSSARLLTPTALWISSLLFRCIFVLFQFTAQSLHQLPLSIDRAAPKFHHQGPREGRLRQALLHGAGAHGSCARALGHARIQGRTCGVTLSSIIVLPLLVCL